ncbi:hypothetical protein PAXRUDRAFT_826962 [Paxillus rubicundulus Ve08.2h10]|uniref:Uncharacterized protein n=1 Tax=Paxillus rubicundulus Ve08.2h10 TaxID=930991 RepID=A0A0D0DYW5_9AGAM|nr:hypothetical protein PAXRUDRAFT_826962 [Paxillus rubicundulus Ve08.2h10]
MLLAFGIAWVCLAQSPGAPRGWKRLTLDLIQVIECPWSTPLQRGRSRARFY